MTENWSIGVSEYQRFGVLRIVIAQFRAQYYNHRGSKNIIDNIELGTQSIASILK